MKFTYKARTKEGRVQNGIIEASSEKSALDLLAKYELYATSLREISKADFLTQNIVFNRKVAQKDILLFTRQLGTMLKSAIPPLEAFRAQVAQAENPNLREKILRMAESLETGSSLSRVFAMFPKIFSPFFVNIIKSGEATGKVADSLQYLAEHLDRDYAFKQKIQTAMVYPAFIVLVFLGSFGLVVFYILPKLSDILRTFSGKLPWMTVLLLNFSDFMQKGGWILLPLLVIPIMVIPVFLKRSKSFKIFWHKNSLKLPLLGDFFKKYYLTQIAENLSVLVSSGIPITQSIRITHDIIANSTYQKILEETELRVTRGEKISAVFNQYPKQFPSFVTQMVSTGESTGKLDSTLMEMVVFYRQEIERSLEKLMALLEPILLMVLGAGVGILAFAVFVPLFNLGMGGTEGM